MDDERASGIFDEILSFLGRIGGYRDGLLLGVGALYVLGYAVWSINAWANNYGLLPAIEAQYFVAGVVPAILIFALFVGFRGTRRLLDELANPPESGLAPWKWRIQRVASVFFITSVIALVLSPVLGKADPSGVTDLVVLIVPFVVVICFPFVLAGEESGRQSEWYYPLIRAFRTISTYYIFGSLFLGGLLFYLLFVFPNLPQEFGGLRPRCAHLDVVEAQVSAETLQDILPPDAIDSTNRVVRSAKVELLFSGGDFMLVRPDRPAVEGDTIYRIRREAVQAVSSCS